MRKFRRFALFVLFAIILWPGKIAFAQVPVIDGQNTTPHVNEDGSLAFQLSWLSVTDIDNAFPDDFSFLLTAGPNYTVSSTNIIPDPDYFGPLSVSVTVNDGTNSSLSFPFAVVVDPVNDPPSITQQSPNPFVTNEDTNLVLSLSNFTVVDVDHSSGFTLQLIDGDNYSITGTTVVPDQDYFGPLTVGVQVQDPGGALSTTFNASVSVTAVNDPPSIVNQNPNPFVTNEDTNLTLNISNFTISDVDHTTGFVLQLIDGDNYSITGTTVVPDQNYFGPLTVGVQVQDPGGALSTTFNASVSVTAVNDPPSIVSQNPNPFVTNEDTNLSLSISNFTISDADHTTGFVLQLIDGDNYSVSGTTIVPDPEYSGPLTVGIRVQDLVGANSAVFNAVVSVTAVNDPPSITQQNPNPFVTNEDTNLALSLSNFTVVDVDHSSGFTLQLIDGDNYSITGTTVVPDQNYFGPLTVGVRVQDPGGALSTTFNASVSVTAVNDPPSIVNQNPNPFVTNEDTNLTLSISNFTISDVDHTTGFVLQLIDGDNYSLSGTTVVPDLNYFGPLTVGVRVVDPLGAVSATFNAAVTVTSVNDPPSITGQSPNPFVTSEDTNLVLDLTDFTIFDVDHPNGFTLQLIDGANYSVSGTTVIPDLNYFGPLTVGVQVQDPLGALSTTFNASVTVTSVNDPPSITGQNPNPLVTNEDTNLVLALSNFTVLDVDHTSGFTLQLVSGPNYSVSGTTVIPNSNYAGPLTVGVRVQDPGGALSATFNASVTVNAVNDPPSILEQIPNPFVTNEDTNLVLGLSNFTISDVDHTSGFTLQLIDGSNYSVSGTTITPDLNYSGTLTVGVRVQDPAGALSTVFNAQVTVVAVNDAPVITGQNAIATAEEQSRTIQFSDLLVNDPDNSYPTGFSMTILTGSNYSVSGTTITPAVNFNGTLAVGVRVSDGVSNSNTFNLSVTVTPVNDPPVITNQNVVTTNEDQPIAISLAHLIVSDPDNTYPTGFSLTVLSGTNYTFSGNTVTPSLNYSGTITVNVRVSDGAANSNTFGLQVSVVAVNDPPIIISQSALSTNEEQPVTITLGQLTVSDVDNSYPTGFSLNLSSGPNYTVSGNVVTPALDFNGVLSVPVTVSDGTSSSAPFNLQITVNPVNDIPQIIGQTPISTGEAQSVTLTLNHLNVFDPDDSYPADFTLLVLSGTNYSVIGSTVTPVPNFSGTIQVGVIVNDGSAVSAIFYLQILVNSVNDPPVITGQTTVTVNEDQPFTITLAQLTVSDPDNSYPADFTLQVLSGTNYTFSGNTVTPATNFNGTLVVKVSVNDGITNSSPFDFQVQVTPVNDPPVITGQSTLTTAEDTPITLQLSDFNVTDPDNTYPAGFTLTVLSGSNYTFSGRTITPATNFNGTLTVPVRVSDGSANSATFNAVVSVSPVNDPPVITGQTTISTQEDQAVTIALSQLTVTDVDNTYPTGFTITALSGTNYTATGATVTPAKDYTGVLSVSVIVNDGSVNSAPFSVSIQVNPVNDAPVISGQVVLTVNEDQPLQIRLSDLTVIDPDNPYPTGFTLSIQPGTNYTVSGTTITPVTNFNGVLAVPVTVNDGSSSSAPFNLQVQVLPVNDPPTITGQVTLSTTEDTSLTLQLSNFTVVDPDNSYPTGFTLTVLAGANYTVVNRTITPAPNFNGDLSVGIVVNDGSASSPAFMATVRVNPINDPPVSAGFQPITVQEDDPNVTQINLTTVFSDPEDAAGSLAYTIVSNDKPTYFQSMAISGTTLSFRPAADFFGVALVTVRATDPGGLSVQSVLNITINGVNDSPSFSPIADVTLTENSSLYTVTITNISSGPYENQQLLLEATSGNTTLIPNPSKVYNGTSSTATISFAPVASQTGVAVITVKVVDPGLLEFTRSFTVNVVNINDPPTLNPISFGPIDEDSGEHLIPLSGITAGPNESQTLAVTATTTKPEFFDVFAVVYQSPQSSGSLRIKTKSNVFGSCNITVTVTDDGSNTAPHVNSVQRTFTLVINSVNDAPVFISEPVALAVVGENYSYALEATDVDPSETITLTAIKKPAWLTLTPGTSGKAVLAGIPPASAVGQIEIQIQARDKANATVIQTYLLAVNSRPLLSNLTLSLDEDITYQFTGQVFSSAFTDAESNPLSKVRVVALPKRGTLTVGQTPVAINDEIENEELSNLRYSPNQDFVGKDTIQWNASDGLSYAQQSANIFLTIQPRNDPPVITTLEDNEIEYHVGTGPAIISTLFNIVDVDSDSLVSAEIGFRRENFVANEDMLIVEGTTNIVATFDPLAGVLTLNGKAPVAEYVGIIRSVMYDNLSDRFIAEDTHRTISYSVSDGSARSTARDLVIRLIDTFEELLIPNAFTPNNDTDNDTWVISNITGLDDVIVRVYDKMGNILFESSGEYREWDGSYNGQPLPVGSYFYTVDLNIALRKKSYRGTVTILH